jgi:hypothetical protein
MNEKRNTVEYMRLMTNRPSRGKPAAPIYLIKIVIICDEFKREVGKDP